MKPGYEDPEYFIQPKTNQYKKNQQIGHQDDVKFLGILIYG